MPTRRLIASSKPSGTPSPSSQPPDHTLSAGPARITGRSPPAQLRTIHVSAATKTDAWPTIGRFFTTLSAAGLRVVAALAVVLLAGGYATMRRITV